MDRKARTKTMRKESNLVVTGSKGRKIPEDEEEQEKDYEPEEEWEKEEEKSDRKADVRLLTTIQIVVCGAVLLFAVALRIYGGATYSTIRDWYFEALDNSIVADTQMENMKQVVIDLWSSVSNARGTGSSQTGQNTSQSVSSQPQQNSMQENGTGQSSQAESKPEKNAGPASESASNSAASAAQ